MKTTFPHRQFRERAATSSRRGGMFAYFLIYLLLAGVITGAAGTMLHLMFQTRKADAKRADGIRQLLRIDQQLRTDWESVSQFEVANKNLTINTTDRTTISYVIEADIVQRIVRSQDNEIQATDRFRFPKGSILEFEDSDQLSNSQTADQPSAATASGLVFRLTSPEFLRKEATVQTPSATGQQVEIYLSVPPEDSGTETVSGDETGTDKEPS